MRSLSFGNRRKSQMIGESNINNFPGYQNLTVLQRSSQNFQIYFQNKFSRKIQGYWLCIEKDHHSNWLDTYNWRGKTQLPIVKTFYIKIQYENQLRTEFQVFTECIPYTLDNFSQIPLSQALYIVKESLIGFQRLYQKFGSFKITSGMIGINENKKCKVWVNENFSSNVMTKNSFIEKDLVENLSNLVSKYVLKTQLSQQFFIELQKLSKVVHACKYIDSFIRENRLKVPFKFTLKAQFNILKKNTSLQKQVNCRSNSSFYFSNTSEKISNSIISLAKRSKFTDIRSPTSNRAQNNYFGFMKDSHEKTNQTSYKHMLSQLQIPSRQMQRLQIQMDNEKCRTPEQKSSRKSKQSIFRSEINEISDKKQQNVFNIEEPKLSKSKYQNLQQIMEQKAKLSKVQSKQDIQINNYQNSQISSLLKLNGWQQNVNDILDGEIIVTQSVIVESEQPINTKKKEINCAKLDRLNRHKEVIQSTIKMENSWK